MLVLKKLLSALLLPISLCLEIFLLGLLLQWFTRKERTGRMLVTLGVLLFALLGWGIISDKLLDPLEYRYPPLLTVEDPNILTAEEDDPIKWVVVLAGGHTYDPQIPITSRISKESLVRLIEGIRLYRQVRGSRLLLSGRGFSDSISEAESMAHIARSLGVDPMDLALEEESRDTKDQARLVPSVVGHDRFILVTSASHMPRSIAMFRELGLRPIPAPIGHLTHRRDNLMPLVLHPNSEGLLKAEMAIHEYLGLAWAKLRGQI